MTSETTDTATKLIAARQSKDRDAIAVALIDHADTFVRAGKLSEARALLSEAVTIHQQKQRDYDEARCTQFIATLYRLEGHLEAAKNHATRAKKLAGQDNPVAVSALTELGETALAGGDANAAAEAFQQAIHEGQNAGLLPAAQSVLRRKRATALTHLKQFSQAAEELQKAFEQLQQADNHSEANQTKIEQASVYQISGDTVAAKRVLDEVKSLAEQTQDNKALANVHLLLSTQAVEDKNLTLALQLAKVARDNALQAVDPLLYISAACAISELADKLNDRLTAYEALVVGWVTVGDVLGKQVAKETFTPKIEALISRWGETEFRRIKTEYEDRRRSVLSGV